MTSRSRSRSASRVDPHNSKSRKRSTPTLAAATAYVDPAHSLLGQRIPVQRATLPFATSAPTPLPMTVQTLLRNDPDVQALFAKPEEVVGWVWSRYMAKTQTYTIHYIVPFEQRRWRGSGKGSNTKLPSQVAASQRYASTTDTMFVDIQLCGTHEHQYHFFHYCRVEHASTRVLVMPMFMTQEQLLQALETMVVQQRQANGPEHANRMSAPSHRFIAEYTLSEVASLVHNKKHPTPPAYVETSAKSRKLQRLEAAGVDIRGNGHPRVPITTFRTDRRQPQKTIDRLKSFGTELVKVRELSEMQSLDGESMQDARQSLLQWLFGHTPVREEHPLSIRSQLRKSGVRLENYLNHPQKLALVAFAPRSDKRALRGTAASSPFRHERVVAVSLFTFVPYHKPSQILAHVHLDAVFVDHPYDELRQTKATMRTEDYGIHANFVRACTRYALHVGDDHDIVYDQKSHGRRDAIGTRLFEKCGFVSVPWPPVLSKMTGSAKTRAGMALVYSALTIGCASGDWKACVARVRKLHPHKPFSEQLQIASTHYSPTTPSGVARSAGRANEGAAAAVAVVRTRRSKRQVTVAKGAQILRDYYLMKHAGLQLDQSMDEWADAAVSPQRVQKACQEIRRHLRHTQKRRRVLTLEDQNTWKYRPTPGKPITEKVTSGGPDSYYLKGLDVHSPEGKALYMHPLGKTHTPTDLVHSSGNGEG
jgi:hypothetical protein